MSSNALRMTAGKAFAREMQGPPSRAESTTILMQDARFAQGVLAMNAARIRLNRLYVVRGRGVARCVRAGDLSSRPTMLWCYEEPVPADDVVREAGKDDVPARLHHVLFGSDAEAADDMPIDDRPAIGG